MTPENFCYWLQGYFELSNSHELTDYQLTQVKEHLNLVFKKVTNIPPLHSPTNIRPINFPLDFFPQGT